MDSLTPRISVKSKVEPRVEIKIKYIFNLIRFGVRTVLEPGPLLRVICFLDRTNYDFRSVGPYYYYVFKTDNNQTS